MTSTPKPKAAARRVAPDTDKISAENAPPKVEGGKRRSQPQKAPAPKADAAVAQVDSVETVTAAMPEMAPPILGATQTLKMKEFVDTVALLTGDKKPDVKRTLEAALAFLGATLSGGEGFVLPGLGKGKVVKSKALGGGEVMTLKLKRGAEKNATPPLAEPSY